MYDPTIGQFISEDPIEFEAGDPNLRRYVGNSPTNATDPSGLEERKPIRITFLDRDDFAAQNPAARHRFFKHRYDSWHYGVNSDQQIFDILGLDPNSVTTRLEFTNFYANERHPYVSIRGKDKQGNSVSYCAAYEGVYNGKPLIGYTFYHTPGHLAWELTGIDKLQALQTIAPYYGLGGGGGVFMKLQGASVPLMPFNLLKRIPGFSKVESALIHEGRAIMNSAEMAAIREAHAAGRAIKVRIGGRLIQYEPGLPASGMTMFGDNGFLIGREAFETAGELERTVLHEIYRLRLTRSGGGVSGALAAQETRTAAAFANRACGELAK